MANLSAISFLLVYAIFVCPFSSGGYAVCNDAARVARGRSIQLSGDRPLFIPIGYHTKHTHKPSFPPSSTRNQYPRKHVRFKHPNLLQPFSAMPSTILVDLSPVVAASDAAQVVASATLAAKADNTPSPAPLTDTVKENHSLAKQNQALAIVILEMKSREDRAAYWYKELEGTNSALYSRIANQHYTIEDLEARLVNNQAELISELQNTITTLQDTITLLEEDVEAASWNEWHKNEEIRRLEEMVDSKNILGLEKALDWERSRNRILRDEMSDVCMKKNRKYFELYTQFRNLQASHLEGRKAGERDKYMSDDNVPENVPGLDYKARLRLLREQCPTLLPEQWK